MGNWLTRLLGRQDGAPQRRAQASSPAAPVAAASPESQDSIQRWQPPEDIDALFFESLLGVVTNNDTAALQHAKAILDMLERQLQGNAAGTDLIPRVPSVIPQLLQSLRDENISGGELSQEIARDVTLVGEVLRQANSSYYNLREPVASIENAVLILGKNTLRLLIAKAAFRPIINIQSGHFTRIAAPYLWDQSDKCALACRLLAPSERVDPFAASLAGLMQNVGMIIAFRLADLVHDGSAVSASEHFRRAFVQYARQLSVQTAVQWELPPAVVQVLEQLCATDPAVPRSALAGVVFASDQLSKLRILINQGHLLNQGAEMTADLPQRALQCLKQLNETATP